MVGVETNRSRPVFTVSETQSQTSCVSSWTGVVCSYSGRKKVKSLSRVWLFCHHPIDCSLPGSSHGIFQARILEWVAISFSRGSSPPRDRTRVSHIVGRRFPIWATREVWKSSWKKIKSFWKKKTSSRASTFFPKYFHVVIHIQCVVFSKRNYYACNRTNRRKPAVETGYTDYS